MLTCRWTLAVLVITSVVGVTVVSAVRVASVRIIPSYGTIKVISAVNASLSIPSYGVINYEPRNLEEDAIEKPNIIEEKTKGLNVGGSNSIFHN